MSLEINIDASSLSSSACILNWYRVVVEGYTGTVYNAAMVYGTAVHKYIDTMYKTGGNIKLAQDAALKSFRIPKIDKPKQLYLSDERHMITTCFMVWDTYISLDNKFSVIELNGQPATEQTFRIPYYTDDNISVFLCGTIDSIGKIQNGIYAIRDFKTTSSWQTDSYLANYEMSAQLRFYVMVCRIMSEKYPDSIIGKIGAGQLGAFIDAIFIKAKANDNVYERSEVYQFKEADIAEFRLNLDYRIRDLSAAVANKSLLIKQGIMNGTCEKKYGRCMFWQVCKTQEPAITTLLLARDFKQRKYDPLNFGKE